MAFDYSKLLGRIIEKFGTRAAFAEAVGLAESSVSNRLKHRVQISSEEIMLWGQVLDIPAEEIPAYFLTPEVR